MKTTFYIIAAVLFIGWIVGFFILGAGSYIHLLIAIAPLSFLHGLICNPRCFKKEIEMKFKQWLWGQNNQEVKA